MSNGTITVEAAGLICQVDQIDAVIALASAAVRAESDTNEELTHAWCSLDLARAELARMRGILECISDSSSDPLEHRPTFNTQPA